MLPDFELIQLQFPKKDDITIIPISDVHLGSREFLENEWQAFLDSIKDKPNVYLTLGGDLINNGTRSSVSNIFEETLRPSDQKKLMVKYLEPLRDRIICGVCGNHERRSGKDADDDPMYDIMCKLDIEDRYRENIAFVKIRFGDIDGCGTENPTYTLVVTHGAGGGIYTGAAVNRSERFGYIIDGMDVLILGHTHKPFITQPSKLFIDKHNNRVSLKPFKVITSTAWLEYGGYAAQKQLLPASHALQTVTLRGNRKEIIATM